MNREEREEEELVGIDSGYIYLPGKYVLVRVEWTRPSPVLFFVRECHVL